MALIKNKENEECKAEIMKRLELYHVPESNGSLDNVDCIYYNSFFHTIRKEMGLGMHVRNEKTGELGDSFDYLDSTYQQWRSVPCLSVIALLYNDEVIYQNDKVVTKHLAEIEEKIQEVLWNRRIINARDKYTGKISIPMAMNNQKYEYKEKEKEGDIVRSVRNVSISVLEKFVERDLCDVGGVKGVFHAITIPKGTMVEGKDFGDYKLLVRDIRSEDGIAVVTFSADRKLTLNKGGSKVKVSAGELNEGLGKLYIRKLVEQEKQKKQSRENREEYSL